MLRCFLLAQLGVDTRRRLSSRSSRVLLRSRSLDTLRDWATTTGGSLAVALGWRSRAAVELAAARRFGLGLVEARAFARFVAHVGGRLGERR